MHVSAAPSTSFVLVVVRGAQPGAAHKRQHARTHWSRACSNTCTHIWVQTCTQSHMHAYMHACRHRCIFPCMPACRAWVYALLHAHMLACRAGEQENGQHCDHRQTQVHRQTHMHTCIYADIKIFQHAYRHIPNTHLNVFLSAHVEAGIWASTRGGTRTRNLLLRREAPYPLGHTSSCLFRILIRLLPTNWFCFSFGGIFMCACLC